ncbi:MAG TPA: TaqI-like C-terminal specificity domain-containing protein [Anaerolineaceae bacterium]|nr:TaqI-like C-terminal specificity domain-containing protein [Anaerolineaceae bacterium]
MIKGGDSRRYCITRKNRLILFPYMIYGNKPGLIPASDFRLRYPLSWAYLLANKPYLENREEGKMKGDSWYGYIYPKALDVMPLPKIFTPDIAAHSAFSLDDTGDIFFTGGVAGGYGILFLPEYSREYMLGLLNSRLLEWFNRRIATQMRGGYYSYEARFIRNLPIIVSTRESTLHSRMVGLVEQMLALQARRAAAQNPQELELLARQIEATDRAIDALVYQLYGLSEAEIKIVEG